MCPTLIDSERTAFIQTNGEINAVLELIAYKLAHLVTRCTHYAELRIWCKSFSLYLPIYLDSGKKFLSEPQKKQTTQTQLSLFLSLSLRFPTRLQLETDLLNLFTLRCRCRSKMPEPSYRFMDVGIFLAYFCKRNFRHLRFALKRERERESGESKAKTMGNLWQQSETIVVTN